MVPRIRVATRCKARTLGSEGGRIFSLRRISSATRCPSRICWGMPGFLNWAYPRRPVPAAGQSLTMPKARIRKPSTTAFFPSNSRDHIKSPLSDQANPFPKCGRSWNTGDDGFGKARVQTSGKQSMQIRSGQPRCGPEAHRQFNWD